MADRERDAPVGADGHSQAPHERTQPSPGDVPPSDPQPALPCPECGFPRLTMLTDSEVVTVLKCPRCAHLSAPVKGD
jgi:hypothetical protein